MTRHWTGWVAWSALAVVVGIPSANLALSGQGDTSRQQAVSALQFQPETDAETQPFFGPPMAGEDLTVDEGEFIGPMPAEAAPAPEPEPVPETAAAPEPESEATADAPVAATDEAGDIPLQPMPTTSDGVRIVGDPALARIPADDEKPERVTRNVHPDAPAQAQGAEAETAAAEPLGDPIPLPFRVVNLPSEDGGQPYDANGDGIADEPIRTASTNAGREQVTPEAVAPTPMPAAMRPPEPVYSRTSESTLEDDVRQSLANIRAERARNRGVVPPAPPNDIDVLVPRDEVNVLVPQRELRGSGTFTDPYRYEPSSRSRVIVEDDFAGDSQFYREWSRQNSADLPARRGSGVRLDLLR